MNIAKSYNQYDFSYKQRERLKDLDKQHAKLERLLKTQNKRQSAVEDEISKLHKKQSNCWGKANKMVDLLQERCKHEAGTFTSEKYRDFGNDVLRTHCSLCRKIITERYKD